MKLYSGTLYINGHRWPVNLDSRTLTTLKRYSKEYAQSYCGAKKGDVVEIKNLSLVFETYKKLKKIKIII